VKLENLLENWEDYKVLFHDPVFLILDYDGTLTPIVSRPEDAKLSRDMEEKQVSGVTSKGSRYRKSVFNYFTTIDITSNEQMGFLYLASKIPQFYNVLIKVLKIKAVTSGFDLVFLDTFLENHSFFDPSQNDEILKIFLKSKIELKYMFHPKLPSPLSIVLRQYIQQFSYSFIDKFVTLSSPEHFNTRLANTLPLELASHPKISSKTFKKILELTNDKNIALEPLCRILFDEEEKTITLQKIKILLKFDIDVNLYDSAGTSLLYRIFSKIIPDKSVNDLIPLLIQKGAKTDVFDSEGIPLSDLVKNYKNILDKNVYTKLVVIPTFKRTQQKVIDAVRSLSSTKFRWQELCKSTDMTQIDLKELRLLGKIHGVSGAESKNKRELCKEIATIFENVTLYQPIEHSIAGCVNDTTILGDNISDIPPLYRYTIIDDKGIKYCFDINELMSIIKNTESGSRPLNPYTKTPLPVNDIVSQFAELPESKKLIQKLLIEIQAVSVPKVTNPSSVNILNQKAIRLANSLVPNYVSPSQIIPLTLDEMIFVLNQIIIFENQIDANIFKEAMRVRISRTSNFTIETFIDALQLGLDTSPPDNLETYKLMIAEYINSIHP